MLRFDLDDSWQNHNNIIYNIILWSATELNRFYAIVVHLLLFTNNIITILLLFTIFSWTYKYIPYLYWSTYRYLISTLTRSLLIAYIDTASFVLSKYVLFIYLLIVSPTKFYYNIYETFWKIIRADQYAAPLPMEITLSSGWNENENAFLSSFKSHQLGYTCTQIVSQKRSLHATSLA